MKRRILLLALCLLCVAVLCAAVLWAGSLPADENTPSQTESGAVSAEFTPLVGSPVSEMRTLHVENELSSFSITAGADGLFTLEDSDRNLPWDTAAVNTLAQRFCRLTPVAVVEDPAALGPFGLDQPRAAVSGTFAQREITIRFGTEAAGGVYARVDGDTQIYVLPAEDAGIYLESELSLLSLQVTGAPTDPGGNLPIADWVELGGSVRDTPFRMENVSDTQGALMQQFGYVTFSITAPIEATAAYSAINVADALFGIRALRVVQEQPEEELLEAPWSSAAFAWEDLATGGRQETYLYAGKPNGEGRVHLMRDHCPIVWEVRAADLPWLELQYQELVSPILFVPALDTLSRLDICVEAEVWQFSLTWEAGALQVNSGSAAIDAERFRVFYQSVAGLPLEDAGAEWSSPDTGTPYASITYYYANDGREPDVITVWEADIRQHGLMLNGIPRGTSSDKYLQIIRENCEALLGEQPLKGLYS